jgi:hypothetical protein
MSNPMQILGFVPLRDLEFWNGIIRANIRFYVLFMSSALGHKQTFAVQTVMSALPPKADIGQRNCDLCERPIAVVDYSSINCAISAEHSERRNREAQRICSVEINHQRETRGLFHRDIVGVCPLQNLVHDDRHLAEGAA